MTKKKTTTDQADIEPQTAATVDEDQRDDGDLAETGRLCTWSLNTLKWFLTQFDPGRPLRTLETGCGASTILFSKHSASHVVYTADDGADPDSLATRIKKSETFDPARVTFVHGPTWQTLSASPQVQPIDLAVIGGHRGHPVPHAEYLMISRWIRSGSILVVPDIHIPTVNDMFRIMCADENLYLNRIDGNTAFFWCAAAPGLNPDPARWWLQGSNVERFPTHDPSTYNIGYRLPFKRVYGGWNRSLPPECRRGFALDGGQVIVSGRTTEMNFALDEPIDGAVELALELDVVLSAEQMPQELSVRVNGRDVGNKTIESRGFQTVSFNAALNEKCDVLDVLLYRASKSNPASLPEPRARADVQRGAAVLRSVSVSYANASSRPVPAMQNMDGAISVFEFQGRELCFFVNDRHDSIQAHHAVGQLYEIEELELLRQHIQPGWHVLDIGANIGNHTVWFEKVAGAGRVVAIEPQPRIIRMLRLNVALNNLTKVDLSRLGCALGKRDGRGSIHIPQAFNPAGGEIRPDPDGVIPIRPGDDVVGNDSFDFLKIDVEGAELDVINGLSKMIARSRPMMFVEVATRNHEAFLKLMDDLDYEIISEYRRYDVATNLLVRPKSKSADPT